MAMQLLRGLAGNSRSQFHCFLEHLDAEPRIAWYPCAGDDFRDLLFLNPRISEIFPAEGPEPSPPDLFIHTDTNTDVSFLNRQFIHDDRWARVSARSLEELPSYSNAVRAFFFWADLESDWLGSFSYPVLYLTAENAAFCAEQVLAQNASLSHLVHVRCVGLFQDFRTDGAWLLNILRKVNCECFISDGHLQPSVGDYCIYDTFPMLGNPGFRNDRYPVLDELRCIRVVPGRLSSDHGDVHWYVL